mmetsp:Transcript_880/g.1035  ORF Transcript_880/g.1035 Transcript_880/m.1035 type:complete len:84 (+) Transcript_880:287-538(+)
MKEIHQLQQVISSLKDSNVKLKSENSTLISQVQPQDPKTKIQEVYEEDSEDVKNILDNKDNFFKESDDEEQDEGEDDFKTFLK